MLNVLFSIVLSVNNYAAALIPILFALHYWARKRPFRILFRTNKNKFHKQQGYEISKRLFMCELVRRKRWWEREKNREIQKSRTRRRKREEKESKRKNYMNIPMI